MSHAIKITTLENSNVHSLDFDNIPFGKIFTDHMYEAHYDNGEWGEFAIKPLDNLSVHPGNLAWHYGQSIFEGMKATKGKDGAPLLFRPQEHIYRLNSSAERMCMPAFPEDAFLDAVHTIVKIEEAWIPPSEGSALYIRPLMFATDEAIGVRPSDKYTLLIMCLPVGPYYPKPVSLLADTKYIRAAMGGVGEAKTAGNYAASLYPAKLAKEEGYDQIMWLDAKEHKFIQEVGTMNIFFVIDGNVITPITEGTILKGITRKTVIHLLEEKGYDVEQRRISIDEIVESYNSGKLSEVFGTGTAALVANVYKFKYKDTVMDFDQAKATVSAYAKATINGLRNQSIVDTYGWVVEAGSYTKA